MVGTPDTCMRHETDVLGSVLLEASLASTDLGWRDFTALEPVRAEVSARALSSGEAAYVRALTIGRRPRRGSVGHPLSTIAVPVRLVRAWLASTSLWRYAMLIWGEPSPGSSRQ